MKENLCLKCVLITFLIFPSMVISACIYSALKTTTTKGNMFNPKSTAVAWTENSQNVVRGKKKDLLLKCVCVVSYIID